MNNINNIKAGAEIHAGDGGYGIGTQEKYEEFVKVRNQSLGKLGIEQLMKQATDDLDWFRIHGHWVIRKVPNTKDQFYVACGHPPANVLEVYGIKL